MTSYKLRQVLLHIYGYTHPGETVSPFYVRYVPKELKSKHGDYDQRRKIIHIYNFSRPPQYLVSTAIHEFAHHICYTTEGNANHDREFYKEFKALLTAAVVLGYVDYEELRKKEDSIDIRVMEKKIGPIVSRYCAETDVNSKYRTVQVANGYEVRRELAKWGFVYSNQELIWEKDASVDDAEFYRTEIEKISSAPVVRVKMITDLSIDIVYLAVVSGKTFDIKEILKNRKYQYKKRDIWHKKIPARELESELEYFKNFKYVTIKVYGLDERR